MKQFFSLAVICMLVLCSCVNKKQQEDSNAHSKFLRPVTMSLSADDTLQINQKVKQFVDAFSQNDFEEASRMLYYVHNDSVTPLTDKDRQEFVQAMQHFTVYGCKVYEFILRAEKNNQVKLAIQIFKEGNLEKGEGVTYFSLNPVRKDNNWYLTVLDERAEGVEDYYK